MSLVSHSNAAGDVSIGIEDADGFVPFVTLSAAKVAQLRERHETLTERAKAGDELAIDALGSSFKRGVPEGGTLADLSQRELVQIARQKGIDGVNSKTPKAELVAAIEDYDAESRED